MKKAKKIIKIAVIVILAAFVLYNIVWGIFRFIPFYRNVKGMERTERMGQTIFSRVEDGLHYEIQSFVYLCWEGDFYTVYEKPYIETVDSNGVPTGNADLSIELFVWLMPFGETKYGLDFMSGSEWLQVYVDKDGNILEASSEENRIRAEELIQENQELCDRLLSGAQEMWDLE